MIRAKLKAFLGHLGISLLIFLVVLYFIVFQWYPSPFFASDGGWQGIRIIAAVDLVLGPLLTLIVYKPHKPGLKFDFSVIGIIQAGALAWGCWVVHYERPIAAVFAENFFVTVKATDMENRGLRSKELEKFGDTTPVWIYSDLPTDKEEVEKIRKDALRLGRSVHTFAEYYTTLDQAKIKKIAAKSYNMEEYLENKPIEKEKYQHFIKKHNDIKDKLIFIPWHARYIFNFIALRSDNLEYVGTLDIVAPQPDDEQGTH